MVMKTIPAKLLNSYFFDFSKKYRLIQSLGEGSFGVVVEAIDTSNNKHVAIKKLKAFTRETIILEELHMCLREMSIMRILDHPNILSLKDVVCNKTTLNSQVKLDVYLVLEKMDYTLNDLIYCEKSIKLEHLKLIIVQILLGLYYLHSANIIHRDLCPRNILLNDNCTLKLCDYGLSRFIGKSQVINQHTSPLTCNTTSIDYRAPENFYNIYYNVKIDIWSLGCIIYEIITKEKLFNHKNEYNLLENIIKTFGTPSYEDIEGLNNNQKNNIKLLAFVEPSTVQAKVTSTLLKKGISFLDDDCLDLLSKMLVFNPKKRISASQALDHPFLEEFRKYYRPVFDSKGIDLSRALYTEFDEKLKNENAQAIVWAIEEVAKSFSTIYEKKEDTDTNTNPDTNN